MKDKIRKKSKNKILANSGDKIGKNQDYRSNNNVKNKLKFDKKTKNKN